VHTLHSAEYELHDAGAAVGTNGEKIDAPTKAQQHADGVAEEPVVLQLQEQALHRKRGWEREQAWEREWEWEGGEGFPSAPPPLLPPSSILDRLLKLKLDIQDCERMWTLAASDAASLSFAFHDERRNEQNESFVPGGKGATRGTTPVLVTADVGVGVSAAVDVVLLNALLVHARGTLSASRQLHRALQQELWAASVGSADIGCGKVKGAADAGTGAGGPISASLVAAVAAAAVAATFGISIVRSALRSWGSSSSRKKKPKLN
jgi:hypothetical protein